MGSRIVFVHLKIFYNAFVRLDVLQLYESEIVVMNGKGIPNSKCTSLRDTKRFVQPSRQETDVDSRRLTKFHCIYEMRPIIL